MLNTALEQTVVICSTSTRESTLTEISDDLHIWKAIPGFENYAVSNRGVVKNTRNNRPLATRKSDRGLHKVSISKFRAGNPTTLYVHRLVAEAFLPDFVKGRVVSHIDGNEDNNVAGNLQMGRRKKDQ